MKKYRILESRGLFHIQTQVEESPFLQSVCLLDALFIMIINLFRVDKNPTYRWTGIDICGNALTICTVKLSIGSFPSLEKAKQAFELITKPEVIHDLP